MQNIAIKYSILSDGTERNGQSAGYIGITEKYKNCSFLVPIPHGVTSIKVLEHELNCHNYSIANIAISRFQLISTLNFKRLKIRKEKDSVLVCGLGRVGLGALLELNRMGIQKVNVLTQKINAKKIIENINKNYLIVNKTEFIKYDYIIDATGDGCFLNNIIIRAKDFCNIIILGTPRLHSNINALTLHRKNLTLYGFHEINGIDDKKRNTVFNKILKANQHISIQLKDLIRYVEYNEAERNKILCRSSNILQISVFYY